MQEEDFTNEKLDQYILLIRKAIYTYVRNSFDGYKHIHYQTNSLVIRVSNRMYYHLAKYAQANMPTPNVYYIQGIIVRADEDLPDESFLVTNELISSKFK